MPRFIDLTGNRFGKLLVIERYIDANPCKRRRTKWKCACDCGNECIVDSDNLKSGRQISCGCERDRRLSEMRKTHGLTDTKLYDIWSGMKSRCNNSNSTIYSYYGERGISVCDQWQTDFLIFREWALQNGYDENAPRGKCTIDRIDVNGNYCPENCRIITQQEQVNNIRTNHWIEHNGETHTLAQWSRITGIASSKICRRIRYLGWSTERALTTK